MPQRSGLSRSTQLLLLLALTCSAALLLRAACAERASAPRAGAPEPAPAAPAAVPVPLQPQPARPAPAVPPPRSTPPPPAHSPVASQRTACAPRARKACHDGDVWWFDSCDRPAARIEACEGRSCTGISCAPAARVDSGCGALTAYGVCEGDVARACIGGRSVGFDCAEYGERCVMTGEGAACLQRGAADCEAGAAARCDGDRLRQCIDGRWHELDCRLRLARCEPAAAGARCGASDLSGSSLPSALATPPEVEACNQLDDDADGQIDEGGACDPIALVAFVAKGSDPVLVDEAQLQAELAIVNRVFDPLVFVWAQRIEVDPRDLALAPLALGQLVAQLAAIDRALLARDPGALAELRIPVLFVAELGQRPPKAGLSTLPNNRCGGLRVSDQSTDPRGVILVSDDRQPETLAHELGHYLGLCHTHEELSRFAQALAAPAPACEVSGDGVCDTPVDPGSPPCAAEPLCAVNCPGAAEAPDALNIMSYYFGCRRALSAEQMAEVEHTLGLRHGWARCLDLHDCPCTPGAPNVCPTEMSCQPGVGDGWGCALDGAALPGAVCHDASQCSLGSFCLADAGGVGVAGRCVRPCRPELACTCSDIGLPFPVCSEDLRR